MEAMPEAAVEPEDSAGTKLLDCCFLPRHEAALSVGQPECPWGRKRRPCRAVSACGMSMTHARDAGERLLHPSPPPSPPATPTPQATLENGLVIQELKVGKGITPSQGDTCTIHFSLFYNGAEIESSRESSGAPPPLPLREPTYGAGAAPGREWGGGGGRGRQ